MQIPLSTSQRRTVESNDALWVDDSGHAIKTSRVLMRSLCQIQWNRSKGREGFVSEGHRVTWKHRCLSAHLKVKSNIETKCETNSRAVLHSGLYAPPFTHWAMPSYIWNTLRRLRSIKDKENKVNCSTTLDTQLNATVWDFYCYIIVSCRKSQWSNI